MGLESQGLVADTEIIGQITHEFAWNFLAASYQEQAPGQFYRPMPQER
jgi:hypothetical protein